MGKKQSPASTEPDHEPAEEPTTAAQDPFPDHGPLPLPGEEIEDPGESRDDEPTREFYRATSDPDIHKPHVPKKRVKVRRKNDKSVPEWERGENSEESGSSAEPDHASSESRRGRRKRRPPTKLERFLLLFTPKVFIVIGGSLFVVILAAAVSNFFKDPEPSKGSTSTSPSLADSGGVFTSFITEETRLKALAALEAYFAAADWEQKLPLVRDPDRVRPLMEDWYSRPENLGTDTPAEISETDMQKQELVGGRIFIMMAVMVSPDNRFQFCCIEKLDSDTFKVDWEVTEQYREVSLAKFQADQPQTPTPFRAFVQDTNFYNGQFADETRYHAYSLTNPADPEFKLWAYVERGTPLESQLGQYLPPLTGTSMILELAYPENPTSTDQVIIKSIAHPNWFY